MSVTNCKKSFSLTAGCLFSIFAIGPGCSGFDLKPATGTGLNTGGAIGAGGSSDSTAVGGTNAGDAGDAAAAATSGGTSPVLAWTQLYNTYFAAGTAGNCVSVMRL